MPKILAVDDSPAILTIIKDILTPEYEVITASNGKEAVDIARREMPDLVIMDIVMPEMDGIEATGVIKKDPATRSIPVLILTSRSGSKEMVAGLDAGADDFVEKSFNVEVLRARVRSHLRAKSLFDTLEQLRRDQEIALNVTRETTSTLNILNVLHTMTKKIAGHLNLDRCSVVLVDEGTGHGLVMASSDAPDIGGQCIYLDRYPEIKKVLETMKTLIIDDVSADPLMREVKARLPYKSLMVVPIIFRDEVIGTMLLRASRGRGGFSKREADLSQMIANSAANAIKNAFLYEGLEEKKREIEKANEKLLELDRLKSNFLAMAAHELRSPLGVINGYLEMILEGVAGPLSQKAMTFLTMALESGTTLTRTVEEILDISIIESGKLSLSPRHWDMTKVMEGVLEFMGRAMEEKGIKVNISCDRPEKAFFDRKKIEQVLINLISNAVKFTPTGGEITVRMTQDDKGLAVAISDTGCGIPEDDLEKVFDEFYTGQSREKGAGLGLSICKRLVEMHGGRIWAESKEGEGSTFYFTLPKVNRSQA